MVIGAGWNGARAFTATSGPGISLMNEFIGLAYFAEIPAVIFDVQRGGPSHRHADPHPAVRPALPAPTPRHGDTKHVLLFPEDPHECFEFGAAAFDLADRLQTPIFVMLDLDIGMNDWLCEPFALGRQPQPRPRQGDDRRGARGRQELRPLPRRRRRRHPVPHLSRHAPDQGRLLHPRHLQATATPRYTEEGARLCRQHGAAAAEVRHRQADRPAPDRRTRRAADPHRRDLLRLDQPGDGRGAGACWRPMASHLDAAARPRPSRSATTSMDFIARARPGLRGRAEPRRPAAHAADERGASSTPAS